MLTKQDLQQIGGVVSEEARIIIREELKPIEEKVTKLEKGVNSIKRNIKKVIKDQNAILGFINKEGVELRKRVDRIEEHIGVTS